MKVNYSSALNEWVAVWQVIKWIVSDWTVLFMLYSLFLENRNLYLIFRPISSSRPSEHLFCATIFQKEEKC